MLSLHSGRLRAASVALAVCAAAGGCRGVQGLTLPGGADVGSHPYRLTAQFADVLSLVPQAAVKVNDVAVGRVTSITLDRDGWTADVAMLLNGDVVLPANTSAHLEQSSLLGEKYILLSVAADEQPSAARLRQDSVIPVARTNRNVDVEEVLGALSLLLNGGGLNQLKTISTEVNKALGNGNEAQVHSLLTDLNTLATNLDQHKQSITDALDGLDRLSATLASRDQQIGTALTDLSPGLKVLDEQRPHLVAMLKALDGLSGVAVGTVRRSKDSMVADLKALAPTLKALADAGTALPDSLQVLVTYPFTDQVLSGIRGDYLNAYLTISAESGTQIIPPMGAGASDTGGAGRAVPLPLPGGVA